MNFEAMKIHAFCTLLLLLVVSHAVSAETTFGYLKEGATNTAKAVGQAAGKAADAVTESVESTRTDLRDETTPEDTRAKLDAMAETTLEHLFSGQPSTRELFERSVGYAVFDTREASFYVVAGYGRGVAVDQRDDSRFYMKMVKTGAGLSLGIGGFDNQIVILFEDGATFESFLVKGFDAAAKGGTMIGEDKNEFTHQFSGGKAVYVLTREGWKIAAQLSGTRYWLDEDLN